MPRVIKDDPSLVVAALVTKINALESALNTFQTKYNATLTKLDADAGVTDTNYNSTNGVTAVTVDPITFGY